MTVSNEVRNMGGAARITQLRERGHSGYVLRKAVTQGELVRPRNGWVALPDLNPEILFAAKHGVVLSCVSLAQLKGLWVAESPERPHVAVRRAGTHVHAQARLHWAAPLIPRDPTAIVDTLVTSLGYVANCLPREHALTIWESALNKGMVDLQSLQQLPLSGMARELLAECRPYSDSGLETLFKTRLRWLRVSVRAQTWLYGHRVDFLIGDRLVVQIDGRQHEGQQKVSDYKHDAILALRGYNVIRVSYSQVMHEWPAVQELILEAMAKGWHLA